MLRALFAIFVPFVVAFWRYPIMILLEASRFDK